MFVRTLENLEKSGNFPIFGQGKPGKVREFHSFEVLTTMILYHVDKNVDKKTSKFHICAIHIQGTQRHCNGDLTLIFP